ncbi:MAG TPA: hypothetical protein VLA20_10425, partial [Vicinamibacterales bacterium]|nr:hypothetical protein [Vicinamibacterales bacterium]
IFYGPVIWFSLHQVNTDVFGDVPNEPNALKKHHRLQLIGTVAIAIILYGIGVHVTDTLEVLSREREGITDGAVYDLIYFLDEGLSHYIQFFPLFFVMGWFLIFDRPGRTGAAYFALFLGVAHGVERAVGIIEGEKWFMGPAVMAWMGTAAWLRWRRVGSAAFEEFFFRHAVAFLVILPICQIAYYLWFGAFPPPSFLSDAELIQMAVGAIVLTAVGTAVVIALDRWLHKRRLAPAT